MTEQEPAKREKSKSLPLGGGESPPTFRCVVYVRRDGQTYRGRVANLAGVEAEGRDQRELLGKIVPAFKASVAESLGQGTEPPWLDPPAEQHADEQKLFIPVHL